MRAWAESCFLGMAAVGHAASGKQAASLLLLVWVEWSASSKLRALGRTKALAMYRCFCERVSRRALAGLVANAAQVPSPRLLPHAPAAY